MTKRTIIFILLAALTLGIALPTAATTDPARAIPYDLTVPEGREAAADHLRDNDYRTRLTMNPGQQLTVTWAEEAGGVLLEWFDVSYRAEISLFSQDGVLLRRERCSSVPYRMYLPAEGARKMTVKADRSIASLCEIKVLPVGQTPLNCTQTGPADLMLIVSSVSDEVDLLGGLLPLYAGEHGIKTVVVFIGRDDGNQVQEAFRALDAMELDVIPVFLQREDHLTYNKGRMKSLWKETKLKEELTGLFLTYRPKVVVTVDPEDKVSMARTPYTGELVRNLVIKTAHNTKLKLTIQKMYHLSQEGKTVLDGSLPLAVYGGRTAAEVAREGYAQYISEASYGTIVPETPRFTLAYTAVGEDEAGNDLFEHIDTGALIAYQAPTPLPTATPEPTFTPEPTATPEPTTVSTEEPAFTPEPTAPAETPTAEPEPSAEVEAPASGFLGLGNGMKRS